MKIESNRSLSVHERGETLRSPTPLDESVTESPLEEAFTEPVVSAPADVHVVSVRAETVHTVRTSMYTPSAVVAAAVALLDTSSPVKIRQPLSSLGAKPSLGIISQT
jgi:hypothetical protein